MSGRISGLGPEGASNGERIVRIETSEAIFEIRGVLLKRLLNNRWYEPRKVRDEEGLSAALVESWRWTHLRVDTNVIVIIYEVGGYSPRRIFKLIAMAPKKVLDPSTAVLSRLRQNWRQEYCSCNSSGSLTLHTAHNDYTPSSCFDNCRSDGTAGRVREVDYMATVVRDSDGAVFTDPSNGSVYLSKNSLGLAAAFC